MLIIRVELHSARTGKVTELARMKIARVVTHEKGINDYDADVLRKPLWQHATRSVTVLRHRAQVEPVWTLICSALNQMGYGAPYARLKGKIDNPICPTCKRNTKAPLFDGCMLAKCPKGYTPCL